MPVLILTMGATGSGKSKLAESIIDLLKIKDPDYFLIDNYVETDKSLKKRLNNFLKKPF